MDVGSVFHKKMQHGPLAMKASFSVPMALLFSAIIGTLLYSESCPMLPEL